MIRVTIEQKNPTERPSLMICGADRDTAVVTMIAALMELETQYRADGHGLVVKRSLLEILRGDEWNEVTALMAAENISRRKKEWKNGKETDD